LGCNKVPAPKLAEGISWRVRQDLRAGEITATGGFDFSDTSFADMELLAGRVGNAFCPSNSRNPEPANDGIGGNESTTTTNADVKIPFAVSGVVSIEVHACFVRGGNPRIATRKTRVTKHTARASKPRAAPRLSLSLVSRLLY